MATKWFVPTAARPKMGQRVPDEIRAEYLNCRFQVGMTKAATCRRLGVSPTWANDFEKAVLADPAEYTRLEYWHDEAAQREIGPPKTRDQMSRLALACLDDFELFRVTVFGRVGRPWAAEAAHTLCALYESPKREYAVINVAPGAGKTTLFSLDVAAWLTCRNRGIRGVLGSITDTISGLNLVQLRTELERTEPLLANADDVITRSARDATHTMSQLFGRLKPPQRGRWSATGIDVEQVGGQKTARKEHTWSVASMEGRFISVRCDFELWDDIIDSEAVNTEATRRKHNKKLDDVLEPRLDAGGLIVLMGQRLHQIDIYRYAIDKVIEVPTRNGPKRQKKYAHITYRAHDEDKCKGVHGEWSTVDGEDVFTEPPAWPAGCLLDPLALPYEDLRAMKDDNSHRFEMVYQQNDASHSQSLVQPLWVSGGTDPVTKEVFSGVWDDDRSLGQVPPDLTKDGRILSYACVDPSVSQYWSLQHYLYDVTTERRYVIDFIRRAMPANELIELQPGTMNFTGIMDDWQNRSRHMGHRITHWIIEANAAQKHMVNDIAIRTWADLHQVRIIGHQTQRNKADPNLGVEALIPRIYKYGKLRLPGTYESRLALRPLVDEATAWPYGATTDSVMCMWFGEYNLATILNATDDPPIYREWRPTWMAEPDLETPAERLALAFSGVA